MKMILAFYFLVVFSFTAFAGGRADTNNREPNLGESEIIFSYNGPQNVRARLYQGGGLVETIEPGSTRRLIVANGSHIFEVRTGVYNERRRETIEDLDLARQLTINAQNNRVSVDIVARIIRSRNVLTGFSVANTVALNLRPASPSR